MSTRKPATPLPWNIAGDEKSGCILKAGNGIASHIARYHDQWICEEHGNTDGAGAFRNAAYIVQAANAYPGLVADRARLVEALRCAVPLIARGIVESAYQDIAAGPQYADRVLERMEALLREMGEEGGAS